jgi:hypothetical protein
MTVPADYHRESGGLWFEVQRCQIMKHIDRNASQFEHLSLRQFERPCPFVDVATHGGGGGNRGKLLEDIGRADIPGMNDVLAPAQRFDCLRTQQAVRVGDDADENGSSQSRYSVLSSRSSLGTRY